ncbi:metallophosphoesterase [Roseobacter sp. HKCCA0434]|uniref:metallophosphoesterase n=1 Tax=Roseobacter sp. HKCCA0434 TaxID=3079297 RepID=UPI002905CAD9|nr:metallophosphoesterase [Roseobacter sp. HKCCA0434]
MRRRLLKAYAKGTRPGALRRFARWAVDPSIRLEVAKYEVSAPRWTGAPLRIAMASDLHVIEPFVRLDYLKRVVARLNAQGADIILLPGDFTYGVRLMPHRPSRDAIAEVLGGLHAPLGVWAVMGNHDWNEDEEAMRDAPPLPRIGEALRRVGIRVMENEAVWIDRPEGGFWLGGVGDRRVFGDGRLNPGTGDIAETMRQIGPEGPALLMMHEPDEIETVPERIALTVCGHTHGGQVTFFGWVPGTSSPAGRRYARGLVADGDARTLVSSGIGFATIPLRLGVIPEILRINLSG